MLEIMKYHARCNREINKAMIEILQGSEKKPYDIQVEGYYKSIADILNHYFIADTVWLKAFSQVRNSAIFEKAILKPDRKWEERQFVVFPEFKTARYELDELMIEYIDELKPEDLGKAIVRYNRKGEKMEKLLWKSVVHMFNHDTHHRGQVSEILDQLKIDNDYSNMIRYD
jgi:uncharacterized damage-inducible protein DinB